VIPFHGVAWLLAGAGVGLFNMLLLVKSVRMMKPEMPSGSVGLVVMGFVIRYVLSLAMLVVAVLRGVGPLLAVGLGLWMARWLGVFVVQKGRTEGSRLRLGLD
jgi:hypothetical protein